MEERPTDETLAKAWKLVREVMNKGGGEMTLPEILRWVTVVGEKAEVIAAYSKEHLKTSDVRSFYEVGVKNVDEILEASRSGVSARDYQRYQSWSEIGLEVSEVERLKKAQVPWVTLHDVGQVLGWESFEKIFDGIEKLQISAGVAGLFGRSGIILTHTTMKEEYGPAGERICKMRAFPYHTLKACQNDERGKLIEELEALDDETLKAVVTLSEEHLGGMRGGRADIESTATVRKYLAFLKQS